MAAYFHSTVDAFLRTTPSEVLSKLTLSYSADGFSEMRTDTPVAWWDDTESLRFAMHRLILARPEAATWQLLLEFAIPRKMKRLDVVLVTADAIVILECKTGLITSEARRQVEDYALLLHYFHKPSDQKHLYPFVVSDLAEESSEMERQRELELPSLPSYWIAPTQLSRWSNLHTALIDTLPLSAALVDGDAWNDGAYRPTPAIIEAALALRSGLRIGAIAQSEAAEQDITDVTDAIHQIVEEARAKHQHSIVFLTGVPGSGKTLVGLSLAHLGENREDAIHFMSGNGPLVSVLQEVFRRHAMSKKIPSAQAQIEAETLIENVHHFAKEYTERDKNRAPSNHVVIFDEAQRAWDLAQSKRKFAREDSEPDMLLKIMERHGDWACVVALVGGGQEINDGEAGLEEWGRAFLDRKIEWHVYASPEVLEGGTSTAYRRLFPADVEPRNLQTNSMLHLRTSNRSLRAGRLAGWVNAVLEGDANSAAAFRIADKFPLFLTRNLEQATPRIVGGKPVRLDRLVRGQSTPRRRLGTKRLFPSGVSMASLVSRGA